jgi:phosphomannomutase/phosphoglucomutase
VTSETIVNPGIFRKYDIRGIVGPDLNEEVAVAVGKAFGTVLRRWEEGLPKGPVAVGRDVRRSSPRLAAAVIEGIVATGWDVVDLGVVPTPVVYFYLHQHPAAGGIIVTGSHNPPEFNGFKMCRRTQALYEGQIQAIRGAVEEGTFHASARRGKRRDCDAIRPYLDSLSARFRHLRAGGRIRSAIKIVVDAGNGTASTVAPRLLRTLGCDVVELYCRPDGRFPHHHPDPTVTANLAHLQRVVRESEADLGVAYDGDADRLGVVDERGEVVWGDRLLILYARQVLRDKAGATCIGDVKCSQLFFDEVKSRGGTPMMSRTGHSLIKARMRETGALLAGEMSGHFFFADRYYGFDDGVYATCRLIEILHAARRDDPGVRFSCLFRDLAPWVATPEIRVFCPEDHKDGIVRRLAERISLLVGNGSMPADLQQETTHVVTLDGLRLTGRNGWGLIRASNTEPALILRFEAANEALMNTYRSFMETELAQVLPELRTEN